MAQSQVKYFKEFKKHAIRQGWKTDGGLDADHKHVFTHHAYEIVITAAPKMTDGMCRKLKKQVDQIMGVDRSPNKRDSSKAKQRVIDRNSREREEERKRQEEREKLLREKEEHESKVIELRGTSWAGMTERQIRQIESEILRHENHIREISRMMTERPGGGSREDLRSKHVA